MQHPRLTVVQLIPHLEAGGVERGTLEVARELVRNGHRSIVISGGGRLVDQLTGEGSEHRCWPIGAKSPRTLAQVVRLGRFLRQETVDILHARSRVPAWVGWLAWKTLPPADRPRFVTTVHGMYSVGWYSRIMTRGEVVIAVSDAVRDYIERSYPSVEAERVQVIHRGVDPAAFPNGFRPSTEWSSNWRHQHPRLTGCKVLTIAGRLTRLKGHHDFISLVERLASAGIRVHGIIVGDEDPRRRGYADELRRRVQDSGLSNQITFLGHRADIREIYAASTMVLSLSSKPESFGRSTLEPLSLGVPVVGYDHGGVGEILRTVFPAGAVPTGDADALYERVGSLLQLSELRVKPFHAFRLQHMLDQTLALYGRLAEPALRDQLPSAA